MLFCAREKLHKFAPRAQRLSVIQPRTPTKRITTIFRLVALAAAAASFGQITLGGVVRATGSGLGCPDWPLCHGRIIPPLETATLIEYSHRLSATVLGVLVLAVVVMAWVYYRSNQWVIVSAVLGLALVILAGALGGFTVLTELAWWVRLLHLAIAEAVAGTAPREIPAQPRNLRLSGLEPLEIRA